MVAKGDYRSSLIFAIIRSRNLVIFEMRLKETIFERQRRYISVALILNVAFKSPRLQEKYCEIFPVLQRPYNGMISKANLTEHSNGRYRIVCEPPLPPTWSKLITC